MSSGILFLQLPMPRASHMADSTSFLFTVADSDLLYQRSTRGSRICWLHLSASCGLNPAKANPQTRLTPTLFDRCIYPASSACIQLRTNTAVLWCEGDNQQAIEMLLRSVKTKHATATQHDDLSADLPDPTSTRVVEETERSIVLWNSATESLEFSSKSLP